MLRNVKTLQALKEMKTDGHAPVLFHCSDGQNYFCKYRIWPKPREINCLAFECVAAALLQKFDIPTPEIALVTISPNTLDKKIIQKNSRIQEGMVVFGSKEIKPIRVVDEFSVLSDKRAFNRLLNPEDIVRIALFDLWIKNGDRGRQTDSGFNYNLLIKNKIGKVEILAFDHGFTFGGSQFIGDFSINNLTSPSGNLYQTTFFRSIIRYIEKIKYENIVRNFVTLLRNDTTETIRETLHQLPSSWDLIDHLEERIIQLLSAHERIDNFAETLLNVKP